MIVFRKNHKGVPKHEALAKKFDFVLQVIKQKNSYGFVVYDDEQTEHVHVRLLVSTSEINIDDEQQLKERLETVHKRVVQTNKQIAAGLDSLVKSMIADDIISVKPVSPKSLLKYYSGKKTFVTNEMHEQLAGHIRAQDYVVYQQDDQLYVVITTKVSVRSGQLLVSFIVQVADDKIESAGKKIVKMYKEVREFSRSALDKTLREILNRK